MKEEFNVQVSKRLDHFETGIFAALDEKKEELILFFILRKKMKNIYPFQELLCFIHSFWRECFLNEENLRDFAPVKIAFFVPLV